MLHKNVKNWKIFLSVIFWQGHHLKCKCPCQNTKPPNIPLSMWFNAHPENRGRCHARVHERDGQLMTFVRVSLGLSYLWYKYRLPCFRPEVAQNFLQYKLRCGHWSERVLAMKLSLTWEQESVCAWERVRQTCELGMVNYTIAKYYSTRESSVCTLGVQLVAVFER